MIKKKSKNMDKATTYLPLRGVAGRGISNSTRQEAGKLHNCTDTNWGSDRMSGGLWITCLASGKRPHLHFLSSSSI